MKKILAISMLLFSFPVFAGVTYVKDAKGKLEEKNTYTKVRKRSFTLEQINAEIAKWEALKAQAESKGVTE